jgi:hypothetical protein
MVFIKGNNMETVIELLGEPMTFFTFDDFIKRRYYIKYNLANKFKNNDLKYVTIYRWYISSRYWLKDKYKYLIWDYLNDYETEETLLEEYNAYVSKRGDSLE